MLVNSLPVFLGVLAGASVGCATLHNGAIHLVDKVPDECGLQIVSVATLSGGDFHGYAAFGLTPQGMVDFHQRLWRYLFCEKHFRLCRNGCCYH